jgi:hypothetical protein
MDLKDLIGSLMDDPEKTKMQNEREAKLEALRVRLNETPEAVTDAEIMNGIRVRFDLVLAGDFLDEAAWLMEALSFTHTDIVHDKIPTAWDAFQNRATDLCPLSLDEYPILESMAQWYFEHCNDEGRDEDHMVVHSLAMYEYLFAQVRGLEASPEYENILAGNGPAVVYLYCGLGLYDRAKFYIQLLESEHKAGRLQEDDYLSVMRAYELLLLKERGTAITNVENELHRITRLCWDTITARDRQVEVLAEENARLVEKLARDSNPALFARGRERLSEVFGSSWERLAPNTRRFIELAEVFTHEPFENSWPGGLPTYTYLAVKSELLNLLGRHWAQGDSQTLCKTDPITLLLDFDKRKLSPEDRQSMGRVMRNAFRGKLTLNEYNVKMLTLLKDHRNQAQHPEGSPSYSADRFTLFQQKLWASKWLIRFLTGCL